MNLDCQLTLTGGATALSTLATGTWMPNHMHSTYSSWTRGEHNKRCDIGCLIKRSKKNLLGVAGHGIIFFLLLCMCSGHTIVICLRWLYCCCPKVGGYISPAVTPSPPKKRALWCHGSGQVSPLFPGAPLALSLVGTWGLSDNR